VAIVQLAANIVDEFIATASNWIAFSDDLTGSFTDAQLADFLEDIIFSKRIHAMRSSIQ
jgi:hypothetical protein